MLDDLMCFSLFLYLSCVREGLLSALQVECLGKRLS
jgi:hypothetical protein